MIDNENEEKLDFVSSYITQKKEKEIIRLKEEIEETRSQVQFLKKEVSVLKLLEENPSDFLTFAFDQSKITVNKLQDIIEELYSENLEKEKKLVQDHENKMSELTDKIQAGKEYAFEILNEIMEKTNNNEDLEIDKNINNTQSENLVDSENENKSEVSNKINKNDFKETKIIQGFWDDNESETKAHDIYLNDNVKSVDTNNKPIPNTTNQKYLYVLGKIAGSDLYDKSGKLIVAKDETITPEITQKAENEGKIIELVLEMKLSEG